MATVCVGDGVVAGVSFGGSAAKARGWLRFSTVSHCAAVCLHTVGVMCSDGDGDDNGVCVLVECMVRCRVGKRVSECCAKKQTFVVKSINSVDGSAFVVASKNEKVFGKFNLMSKQQADGLQALATTVYIVTGSTNWDP